MKLFSQIDCLGRFVLKHKLLRHTIDSIFNCFCSCCLKSQIMLLEATNCLVDASVILCYFISCRYTTPECPDEQLINLKTYCLNLSSLKDF